MTYAHQILDGIIDGSINSIDDIKLKVYSSKAKVPSTKSIIMHSLRTALMMALRSSVSLTNSYAEFEKQPIPNKENHKYLAFLLKNKTEIAKKLQDENEHHEEINALYKMKWEQIISPMTFADVYGVIDQLFTLGVEVGERFTQLVSDVREKCGSRALTAIDWYESQKLTEAYFQYDEKYIITSAEKADVELFIKLALENSDSFNEKTRFMGARSIYRINQWLNKYGVVLADKALQERIENATKFLQKNGYEVILKQA